MANSNSKRRGKKPSCPFGRKYCFTSCRFAGEYADCPLTLEDLVYAELKEGNYRGVTPRTLLKKVRLDDRQAKLG